MKAGKEEKGNREPTGAERKKWCSGGNAEDVKVEKSDKGHVEAEEAERGGQGE